MSPLIILLLMAFATPLATPVAQSALVVRRGHIVCLDAAGKRSAASSACDGPGARFALSESDGKLQAFSADDAATAMFTDARVRLRELQITAQRAADDQLEIVRVQSIREGKLYDIYYFSSCATYGLTPPASARAVAMRWNCVKPPRPINDRDAACSIREATDA